MFVAKFVLFLLAHCDSENFDQIDEKCHTEYLFEK